jgi:hypothetical protein
MAQILNLSLGKLPRLPTGSFMPRLGFVKSARLVG